MQIKDDVILMWLGKLKGDPNRGSKDKYYHFHRDYGHNTSECYDLKQQIKVLIRQGMLQRFISKERIDNNSSQEQAGRRSDEHPRLPLGDIRMIVGGTIASGSTRMA